VALLVGLLIFSQYRRNWKKPLLYYWMAGLVVMGILMKGGPGPGPGGEHPMGRAAADPAALGLRPDRGLSPGHPSGPGAPIRLPAIRSLCVIYIELIRGVPLISLLFMSSVVFPLFLPEGRDGQQASCGPRWPSFFSRRPTSRKWCAAASRAWRKGQYEAAESLGLNYYQTMRLIILPQALKIVIPPSVSILISAFKDTSLVVIIAFYDLLKTTQAVLGIPAGWGFRPRPISSSPWSILSAVSTCPISAASWNANWIRDIENNGTVKSLGAAQLAKAYEEKIAAHEP
jgi:general L-amino acid transport system permease protein